MKKLTFLLLFMGFLMNLQAQNYVGLNIGQSAATFIRTPSPDIKAYKGLSIGIPVNFELGNRFDFRITPTYMRYGRDFTYDPEEPIIFFAVDGYEYLNSITTPVEIRWKFINKQFISSLNGGLGFSTFLKGHTDATVYTQDFLTQEIVEIRGESSIDVDDFKIRRNSLFTSFGLDLGYKIADKFIVGVNGSIFYQLTRHKVLKEEKGVKNVSTNLSLQLLKIL